MPRAQTSLPSEYYEQLYLAGLKQSRLGVELDVRASQTPLIGPLLDRLRLKVHELVVFYINRYAARQAEMDNHVLQALSILGQSASGGEAAVGAAFGGAVGAAQPNAVGARSEWATPEDVRACYHLLLDREPDEHSWNYWSNLVRNHGMSRAYLVDAFLNGQEFKALQRRRYEPQLVELPGFKMYVRLNDNFIGAGIARNKHYEPHVTRVLKQLLRRGHTFIDVGANIGYFSLWAAKIVAPGGRVIAFEPNGSNCDLIRRSLAENSLEDVVELHQAAVAEMAGVLQFTSVGIDSNGRVVTPEEAAAEQVPLQSVDAVTLDDALRDCPRIDVIKMDVEGAEARVWQGMQSVIHQHKPSLVFEFSPVLLNVTSGADPQTFLEMVQTEYDLYIISFQGETSPRPDSIADIIATHAASGQSHLDILGRPRH
ncbi:FkbM family methyltransferase [Promineifilum sp.]|uniref:FkbM family methyltransferase n=1 Tax=Promineifilum sp. TaxID=2664178 RepID=UPI0035B3780B